MASAVEKFCVTETNATPASSSRAMMRAKSSNERERRSTRWTMTMSIAPASMAARRPWKPGRFVLAPVKPPSSKASGSARQPSPARAWM